MFTCDQAYKLDAVGQIIDMQIVIQMIGGGGRVSSNLCMDFNVD